jgi:hypothetical protein
LGNAAFGKSWSDLVPLFADGSDAIKAIGNEIPDLVSGGAITAAQTWNDTWTEIKRSLRGFADVIREILVEYVLPYIKALKDWIKENRELVKIKIREFLSGIAKFVQDTIPKIVKIVDVISDVAPAIFAAWGAFKIFKTSIGIIDGASAALGAFKIAQAGATAAQWTLNAAAAAFPVAILASGAIALGLVAKKAAEAYNRIETAVPGSSG